MVLVVCRHRLIFLCILNQSFKPAGDISLLIYIATMARKLASIYYIHGGKWKGLAMIKNLLTATRVSKDKAGLG